MERSRAKGWLFSVNCVKYWSIWYRKRVFTIEGIECILLSYDCDVAIRSPFLAHRALLSRGGWGVTGRARVTVKGQLAVVAAGEQVMWH